MMKDGISEGKDIGAGEKAVMLDEQPGFSSDIRAPVVVGEGEDEQKTARIVEHALNPDSILLNDLYTKIDSDLTQDTAIDGLDCLPIAVEAGTGGGSFKGNANESTYDDPKAVLDNTKSNIPWHITGRFQSLSELQKMVNQDADKAENSDPFDDFKAVLKAITIFPALINLGKRCTIMKDHFRVAKSRASYKVYGPGIHTPGLKDFTWMGPAEPFDLEVNQGSGFQGALSTIRTITPNHTVIQVGPGCLGIARINSSQGVVSEVGESHAGEDGDTVLFQQGKYLLRESHYRDISVQRMHPDQSVLKIGDVVTLLRINPGQVGGAYNIESNTFQLFQAGKTIVLDMKEWADPLVTDRKPGIFTLGKYVQYVSLSEGEVCSVSRKDGRQFLLGRPGLYVLQHENWNFDQTALQKNDSNYECGAFIVRTVTPDEIGVARNRWTNESWILKSGKYYLHGAKWEVEVKRISAGEVYVKPFTLVQVGEACFVGARNNVSGKWVEFHEKYQNKVIVLHESEYSNIVQVPKTSHSVARFGPYFVLTVPAGKVAIFDRKGKISAEGSGLKKLALEEGLILEPLPTVPQSVDLGDIKFLSSDDYDLGVQCSVDFKITDPIQLSTVLRSKCKNIKDGFDNAVFDYVDRNDEASESLLRKNHTEYEKAWSYSYDDYKNELAQNAVSIVLSRLRTYESSQLLLNGANVVNDKETVEKNVAMIGDKCQEAMQYFMDSNGIGITITKVRLLGGFRYTDSTVIEYFKTRTREAIKAETMIATQRSNEMAAKAVAAAAIEKARESNIIETMRLEEQKKHEQIALETKTLQAQQAIAQEQLQMEKFLESERIKQQQKNELELGKIQAQKERELLAQETLLEKTRKEAEITKLQLELERQREKQRIELAMENAKAERDIKSLAAKQAADDEAYRLRLVSEIAEKRPVNLDIENIMKLMNEGVQHFGQAAWRHPDAMESMIGLQKVAASQQQDGKQITGGVMAGNNYNALMSNSISQALSIMQNMQMQQDKEKQHVKEEQ